MLEGLPQEDKEVMLGMMMSGEFAETLRQVQSAGIADLKTKVCGGFGALS